MYEMVKGSVRCALMVTFALGTLSQVANAQEGNRTGEDIQNVLLTFNLIQADGFTGEDPEISDVVTELRKLFNFQGYKLLSTSVFNVGLVPNSSGTNLRGDGSQRIVPSNSEVPLTIMAEVSSQRSTGIVRTTVTLTDATSRRITASREDLPLLEASVTMRDGQRVMLGTARRTAGEPVLILVVTPRIDPVIRP